MIIAQYNKLKLLNSATYFLFYAYVFYIIYVIAITKSLFVNITMVHKKTSKFVTFYVSHSSEQNVRRSSSEIKVWCFLSEQIDL